MKLNVKYLENYDFKGDRFICFLEDIVEPWFTRKEEDKEDGKDLLYTVSHNKEPIGYVVEGKVLSLPTKGLCSKDGDSGYDLRACIAMPMILKPHTRTLIPNGIKCELNTSISDGVSSTEMGWGNDVEIQVRCRSGLAYKNGIMVVNGIGTIDYGYRGEIGTIIYNSSDEDFYIYPMDRISQLVVAPIFKPAVVETLELSETERGEGGYGHSGSK